MARGGQGVEPVEEPRGFPGVDKPWTWFVDEQE
jgi:hypothetical protein